uniref:E3 ubiquitin protein ligase upl2, putative n=1 Tax=Arundo donax TaxID=35708 RepID=A0A0A9D344_ARUDO
MNSTTFPRYRHFVVTLISLSELIVCPSKLRCSNTTEAMLPTTDITDGDKFTGLFSRRDVSSIAFPSSINRWLIWYERDLIVSQQDECSDLFLSSSDLVLAFASDELEDWSWELEGNPELEYLSVPTL